MTRPQYVVVDLEEVLKLLAQAGSSHRTVPTTIPIEIHYTSVNGEPWAALYVDGKLHCEASDSYLIEENALELVGIVSVRDGAFMRGQKSREGVARTLGEVADYREERERALAEADRLMADADKLKTAANKLLLKYREG